ncbi:hypothetical protein [Nocardia sp. NBC_01327]|uniref:hypothetical protein n=1 Tax=Nocardia sp. NBC_01327 TaxID=2903593 RepID=UPI002E101F07|nr:hypothetical protein OG326_34505 [Nocardia sp. NBC_01327]
MTVMPWLPLAAFVGVAVALAYVLRARTPNGPSVWDIQAELPHRACEMPPTVEEAERDAHKHKRCRPEGCPRRCAALRVLYEAHRVDLPDPLYQLLYEQLESD